MFRKLLPQEVEYFDYFEQHAELCLKACRELDRMLADGGDMPQGAQRIKELEREADAITRACMDALHRTFITPIDRADIHTLIQRLDDIVDSVESTASRMTLYDIADRPSEAKALTAVLVRATEEIKLALPGLRNMKHADEIKQHCMALYELENEGDNIMRNALAKLFREEKDPIALIKWKELFERLEKATDRCEAVASIIQSIVIEAS